MLTAENAVLFITAIAVSLGMAIVYDQFHPNRSSAGKTISKAELANCASGRALQATIDLMSSQFWHSKRTGA